ncbi:stage II sporulation protein M [Halegenticoccus tardaugens]|uniref:stage II sporulation protein M n=1 Tax=Halegenticoccus tardaugens TaxID=2071624 RepID=UPI00100B3163|nr:stage II sporulation protein M [Halegenticoccus tardaugens]
MNVSTALRSGVRLPVDRAGSVLPFYLLATGALVAARVPLLVGLGTVVFLLDAQGRIGAVAREFDRLDASEVDPENPDTIPPELVDATSGLLTPTVLSIVAVSLVAFVVLSLVARAVAAAATLGSVYAALLGDDPLAGGVGGIARHWRAFVALGILRAALFAAAVAPLAIGIAVAATLGPVEIAVALLSGLVSLLFLVAVYLALAFAGQAVVVDGAGALGAVRRSAGVPLRHPVAFLFYVVVASAALVATGILAAALNLAGAPQLLGVVSTLAVLPALDGFKTSLYAETALPRRGGPPVSARFVAAFRRGARRLGSFVRSHPAANLAGLASLGLGMVGGWLLTSPYGVRIAPPGNVADVFGAVPVGTFVNLAANNWLVGAGAAYGGLALGVPTAASLLFNGVLIGALAGVFDPTAFLALVAPHGVIELPAIAVAGGLGFHLGRVGWEALRGRRDAANVGEEIGRAFEALLGLALVLVVAAFVEAFLTPRVAALVLGG